MPRSDTTAGERSHEGSSARLGEFELMESDGATETPSESSIDRYAHTGTAYRLAFFIMQRAAPLSSISCLF